MAGMIGIFNFSKNMVRETMRYLPILCMLLTSCATVSNDNKSIENQERKIRPYYICANGNSVKSEAQCPEKMFISQCPDGTMPNDGEDCPLEIQITPCWDGSILKDGEQCPPPLPFHPDCWDGSTMSDEPPYCPNPPEANAP